MLNQNKCSYFYARLLLVQFFCLFSLFTNTVEANTPTTAPIVKSGACTNGKGWVNLTYGVVQGKQLIGLPVPAYKSSTSYAYNAPDGVSYTLGISGKVAYKFSGEVNNGPGVDIYIYEITPDRYLYPQESALVDLSKDGITWIRHSTRASSYANELGITGIDIGNITASPIRYIRLTDVRNILNLYPDSDGFDLNAIEAISQVCPANVPTATLTPTPSITKTPTPTATKAPSPTPSRTPTPTPTISQAVSLRNIYIDFESTPSAGSPYIFGGSHSPKHTMVDAWNKLESVGVTFIRKDIFPENALPQDITLQDYKNNVNDVQNIANWNTGYIYSLNQIFNAAKNRGMKTMGIMAYSPKWLNTCNCYEGVPADFEVYKDIIKKTYRNYRANLDYIEIWNEPTYPTFLNLSGTTLTREQAYIQIYKTAADAIREVDAEINDGKRMQIGGLAAHSPTEISMLTAMLADSALVSNLDFVTYHNYNQLPEPSWNNYKSVLNNAGLSKPIYMTEWNYFYNDSNPTPFNGGPESISYSGRKFIELLKMGTEIATYHSMNPIDTTRANNGEGTYGFYRWDDTTSTATLLEQSKTWKLMSKTLGLGTGASTIYPGYSPTTTPIIGFTNSQSQKGVVFVNQGTVPLNFKVNISNHNPITTSKVYQAFSDSDGDDLISTLTPVIEGNTQTIIVATPPLSTVGIIFE